MSSFPRNLPRIVSKGNEFFSKLSIRVKLMIFLSAVAGISYQFMLHFKNKSQCERLEPNHVICQQYQTSLERAKSLFWNSSVRENLISYRLTGTERKGNQLYLKTDLEPILFLYEPTEYNRIFLPEIEKIENYIQGRGDSEMTLFLANSRDRQMLLYYLWGFPTCFLFFAELVAHKNAELAAK